jgi:hypothetical protein
LQVVEAEAPQPVHLHGYPFDAHPRQGPPPPIAPSR